MYELIQVSELSYYIQSPAKIGSFSGKRRRTAQRMFYFSIYQQDKKDLSAGFEHFSAPFDLSG